LLFLVYPGQVRVKSNHALFVVKGLNTLKYELRGGTLQRFPDGVALPATLEEICIGLLTPHGGKAYLKHIQKLCKKLANCNIMAENLIFKKVIDGQ
jgi:hypothetical protein